MTHLHVEFKEAELVGRVRRSDDERTHMTHVAVLTCNGDREVVAFLLRCYLSCHSLDRAGRVDLCHGGRW